MLLVAFLIAILNFKIVASFNLKNKKDKDTFCMLKSAGIIHIWQEAKDHQHMPICLPNHNNSLSNVSWLVLLC